MPHFRIETNLPVDKIPQDFALKTTKIVSNILGKPLGYCVCSVIAGIQMAWGESTDPCAIASLTSIGKLGVEENKKHSKILFEHIEKELKIPPTRMYITYNDAPSSIIGYKGTTFHDILG